VNELFRAIPSESFRKHVDAKSKSPTSPSEDAGNVENWGAVSGQYKYKVYPVRGNRLIMVCAFSHSNSTHF
jgi:hypothetical protein